jgi:[acyl-carrier-protein] S-malonyltransferase
MGEPWVGHPAWAVTEEVSDGCGVNVAKLLTKADAEELRQTTNAQLGGFTMGLIAHRAATEAGISVQAAAGHSLGEYTALTVAGVLSITDGAQLVRTRGEAMGEACRQQPSTMAAVIGLDGDEVAQALERIDDADIRDNLWVANHNSPAQVAIAGTVDAINAAGDLLAEAGAKRVMTLEVDGAFHTPLMAPAQAALDGVLHSLHFQNPQLTVAANVDGEIHPHAEDWPNLLSQQLCSPVRWTDAITTLVDDGVHAFIELGSGTTLSGLIKRIARGTTTTAIGEPDQVSSAVERLES